MLRVLLTILLALWLPAGAVHAAEGCGAYSVDALVAEVPYFARDMEGEPQRGINGISFVHRETSALTASVRLQAAAASPVPLSKSEFIDDLRDILSVESSARKMRGQDVTTAVYPLDPVSWTMVSRTALEGGGYDANGILTVRLDSSCQLVAMWRAREVTALATRAVALDNAVDALRQLSLRHAGPSGFADSNVVPTGLRAMVFGFVLPLLAGLALIIALRPMLLLDRPGALPRLAAGFAALAAMAALGLQYPHYLQNLESLTFLDNASLLLLVLAMSLPIAFGAGQGPTLAGLCLVITCGMALGVSTWFAWTPDPTVSAAAGAAFLVLGAGGLFTWQNAPWAEASGR